MLSSSDSDEIFKRLFQCLLVVYGKGFNMQNDCRIRYHFFFSPQFFVEVMGVALGNTRIKLSVTHSVSLEEFSPSPLWQEGWSHRLKIVMNSFPYFFFFQFPFYLTQMKNLWVILSSSLFFLTLFTEGSGTITRQPGSV